MTSDDFINVVEGWAFERTEQLKDDIKNKSVTKFGAVNSSGRLAKSVRFKVTDKKLIVEADDYIYQIEHGRKPGKFPPRQVILDWIHEKPIPSDISEKSLAFLIGRKIAKEGTEIYKQGGSGLLEGVFNDDEFRDLANRIGDAFIKEIKQL